MQIPFTKAHGAKNDFLLTWAPDAPSSGLAETAVAICDRHTGIGADGWMLLSRPTESEDARLRLFNADGSEVEMSGNGTRCAAALLVEAGHSRDEIRIVTGAGLKQLRLLERDGFHFTFEMNMGKPAYHPDELHYPLKLSHAGLDVAIVNVGNPQCVVFAPGITAGWRPLGAAIETHPHFPNRTNVSFVAVRDPHTIEVRFFERGVGETMSSGTGSTGAAVAAILRGVVTSPVRVLTPAGPLDIRWDTEDVFMVGPAEIIGRGEFYQ